VFLSPLSHVATAEPVIVALSSTRAQLSSRDVLQQPIAHSGEGIDGRSASQAQPALCSTSGLSAEFNSH
jgi:hypothetical protein